MEKKRVQLSVPIELFLMLKNEAQKIGTPVSGLINVAIKEYLKQGSVIDMVNLFKDIKK